MIAKAVFTDLDGTLLNHDDYSYADALPAIEFLRNNHIPLILVSSKTRAEMADLCRELSITDPYVCENGSVIVLPKPWVAEFGVDTESLAEQSDCYLAYRGADRAAILSILKPLKSQFQFAGFSDMDVADVIDCTGLSEPAAMNAMRRDATEPLLWHSDGALLEQFAQFLGESKLQLLKGGRFYHVMAQCDKGDAVRYLLNIYQSHIGARVRSIALGDSQNDLKMLKAVDQAVVMPHPDGSYMSDKDLKGELHAPYMGAKGWRAGVEQALLQL
ncbi:HAD-IIB family hydrolase [Gilvimarinus sp. SDUM040013]|uniref:HAD-IIB family hydrolase n=1 Tax=Gilvimarinus gilvus TaxID=3058038 RepID=A0ABU4RV35_9GAMM|nr:HAD-IIB family hydrolase [Gilvimarinus sp. SDUM040013]MDO3387040.1 HAD-IIB family hydrolase [Gilvimarinus sp. SDUM040013]MDX6848066.1 HAD-IIB family hydrolase [Gilvimarinus sp. SDUM040013]